MSTSSTIDNVLAVKILHKLVTPFDETNAYALGIIDKRGHVRKKFSTLSHDEREHYTLLDRLVFSLKRLINKAPGGENKLKNYVAAYWMIKENLINSDESLITESNYIDYLDSISEEQELEVAMLFEDVPTNSTAGAQVTDPVVKKKAAKKWKDSQLIKSGRRLNFKEYLEH